jgi:hypothetical protein
MNDRISVDPNVCGGEQKGADQKGQLRRRAHLVIPLAPDFRT